MGAAVKLVGPGGQTSDEVRALFFIMLRSTQRDLFQAIRTIRTVRARKLARTGQHLSFRITKVLVLSNTMRISIDIDINESEIDLATELLSTLRYGTSTQYREI